MQAMTSKERLLAAFRCQEVDYVPMNMHFWHNPRHPRATWRSERERLALYREWGWDALVSISPALTPSPEVRVELSHESVGDERRLRQVWHTPAGKLVEVLRITDDWLDAQRVRDFLPFLDDFRGSRYVEFAVKREEDIDLLAYLFPEHNPRDMEQIQRGHAAARALADEFRVPLVVEHYAGMDWLTWLYPVKEAVLRVVDNRPAMKRLLEIINRACRRRLEALLELGVDAVDRRGWYESADYWSPEIVEDLATPCLRSEIEETHRAGVPHIYLMATGIMPLLPLLSSLPFDCLHGAEPAYGGQDAAEIRRRLPGKSMWGGISGPEHLGRGAPEQTERAVERAFEVCGRRGFILGMAVGIRQDWPEENLQACERAWRRLRAADG